ncbi:helix-turn-helix domain-containing protein [Metabacillus sp. FJAT-53654]|uniref:Helix-turn-helix domain-containing protein n=1 Tax=Metabacillus rhizosphaerae TaxID=3117747 RepID=A0ABZ2MWB9_9BACI
MEKLNYETIQKYQSFEKIEEMDQAVRGFLYKYKAELSEGTMAVLTFIWKHSVKVVGVSFAKYEYIAEEVNLSRRTVIRAVNVLEERGIIKKVPTSRMNGKQGVNLLVIQHFESIDSIINNKSPQDVTLPDTANKTENKQSSLCEKEIKPTNVKETPKPSSHEMDSSYLPESISKEFVEATKPFLSTLEIYKLWQRVLIVYNKMKLQRSLSDVIDCVVLAFKQTVFAQKLGKIHKTFEGYFYGTLYAKLIVEKRQENKHMFFDFIGEE